MDPLELCYMSVDELSPLIRDGEVSPVEVTQAHLGRIAATEPRLNAFITLLEDQALADAREAEGEIGEGRYRGPLHGISLGLKDLYYTEGVVTTSGVRIYEDFVPSYDSTVTRRMREAGTVLLGKLNLAPLAMSGAGREPLLWRRAESVGHRYGPRGIQQRLRRWPPPRASVPLPWVPTPAAPSESRRPSATWSVTNPPMDW